MAHSLRSHVEPIDPSLVSDMLSEKTIAQYFQVATVTILVYDTMTTMDKEIRYFWKPPWRTVNIVYFANRYIGLLGAVSYLVWNSYRTDLPLCKFAQWIPDIANWTTIILIDYILMIRVLALYSQDRRLSVCLKALLGLEAAFTLGVFVYSTLAQDVVVGVLSESVTVCTTNNAVPWQWGLAEWIIPMMYGGILLVLAIYKAAGFWRMSYGFKGFNLVKVLIEDQLVYFFIVIACSVFSMMRRRLQISNAFLANVLDCLGSPSFLCVLGSRILVNLKEAGEQGLNEGTSYRMGSVSDIEFA